MRLHQINIPAVALMGTKLSDTQCRLLEHIKDFVLMLDGDDAGIKATRQIEIKLKKRQKSQVHSMYLPYGADPDDLSDDELRARLN
jgi:DNA primase